MLVVEDVCSAFEHSLVEVCLVEIVSSDRVVVLAGDAVELVQTVVHAAVLDREHGIVLLLVPCRTAVVYPVSEVRAEVLGVRVASGVVYVDDSGDELMHCVPRHPRLVDDISLADFDIVELDFNTRAARVSCCPYKSGLALGVFLALTHTVDEGLHFCFESLFLFGREVGVLISLSESRKVVTNGVSCDIGVFPAAISCRAAGIESGVLAETGKKLVVVESKQVVDLFVECVDAVGVCHSYVAEREVADAVVSSLCRYPAERCGDSKHHCGHSHSRNAFDVACLHLIILLISVSTDL